MSSIVKVLLPLISKILRTAGFEIKKIEPPVSLWAGLGKNQIRRIFQYEQFNKTRSVKGCIVECGVSGGNTLAYFSHLNKVNSGTRKVWAFDSFEGFPEASSHDGEWFKKNGKPGYTKFTIEYVKSRLRVTKLTDREIDDINFIKGWIPQSFNEYDGGPVSLLNLDVDLYQSIKDSLEYFWPLISKGGVVLLDEYTFGTDMERWPGAKIAIDEFCTKNDIEVQIHYTGKAYLEK